MIGVSTAPRDGIGKRKENLICQSATDEDRNGR
jgi:hypothetical protein